MKLALFALVALSSAVLAAKLPATDVYDEGEERPVIAHISPRTGHFRDEVFVNLYNAYSTTFNKDPLLPLDHDSYYRPTAQVCSNFFKHMSVNNYNVGELVDVIVMDACLGYLLEPESGYRYPWEKERTDGIAITDEQITAFDETAKNKHLQALYDTKLMDEYSAGEKHCVANLLLSSVVAKRDAVLNRCTSDELQMLIQFAECQHGTKLSTPESKQDSYIGLIYRLVKERGETCFSHVKDDISAAIKRRFERQWVSGSVFDAYRDEARKQLRDRKLPKDSLDVLRVIEYTDSKKAVNFRQALRLVSAVYRNDAPLKNKFLQNTAASVTDYYRRSKSKETPVANYEKFINNICDPWRISDAKGADNFALGLVRLLRMRVHEDVFGINEHRLLQYVLAHGSQVQPVFISVAACNLLSNTVGSHVNGSSKKFSVVFVPNTEKMSVFPMLTRV